MAVATAILIGMAVTTAVQAYGQYRAGRAAQKVAESEAEREEFNAQIAESQAQDALERGVEEESRFRQGVRGLIGTQRTAFAGQGVDVHTGSAREVRLDAEHLAELDAMQIQENAEREAWGYRMEAEDRRKAAEITRRGGRAAMSAARWNTAGTIAGGTTSLLHARYGFQRSGPTSHPTGA